MKALSVGSCLMVVTFVKMGSGGVAGLFSASCESCDSIREGAGVSALKCVSLLYCQVVGRGDLLCADGDFGQDDMGWQGAMEVTVGLQLCIRASQRHGERLGLLTLAFP